MLRSSETNILDQSSSTRNNSRGGGDSFTDGSGSVVVSESLTLPKFTKLRKGIDVSHRLMQSTFRSKKDELCPVEHM